MANFNHRFTLKSTHEEAFKVPDIVDNIQQDASLNDDEASGFKLLLSEAVDNAIQHGNKYDAEKNVDVDIKITESVIQASISNEGEGFDPETEAPSDPLSEENLLNPGGRGLFLIKELSDSIEFLNEGKTLQFSIRRE